MPKPVAIRCQISRGGFSGERVVRLRCVDGTQKKGLAPTNYCWNANQIPLGENEPANGQTMEGYVAARELEQPAPNQVMIEIPDGEVMIVPKESIIPRPSAEKSAHVPV
jgi:hypothetical protein